MNSRHGAAFWQRLVIVRGLGRGVRHLRGGKLAPSPAGNSLTSLSLCRARGARRRKLPLGDCFLTTFSDGCLGSNNDEGRSEV